MKKLFVGLLCLIMTFGLVACGEAEPKEPEHTISYIDARKVVMNETEYLGIFCNYSNNSDETCLPCDEVDVRAFQNGIALNIVVYTGQKTEGAIQCDTAVQARTTAEVVWLYELQDDSTISLEFSNGEKIEVDLQDTEIEDASTQTTRESKAITITLDNWQEYFMIEEKAIWQANAFGEYDDVAIWQTIVLKPEYQAIFDITKDFNVAFALEAETIIVAFEFDPQAQTYSYLEAFHGETPQKTDTTVSFGNNVLDGDDDNNLQIIPLRVWSSGVGEREENGQMVYDIYKYQNIEVTRVEGVIYLYE